MSMTSPIIFVGLFLPQSYTLTCESRVSCCPRIILYWLLFWHLYCKYGSVGRLCIKDKRYILDVTIGADLNGMQASPFLCILPDPLMQLSIHCILMCLLHPHLWLGRWLPLLSRVVFSTLFHFLLWFLLSGVILSSYWCCCSFPLFFF